MANTRASCFFLGLGIGTALGVLFAPKPGVETREQLRESAMEGRELVRRRSAEAREQAGQLVDRGREAVRDQRTHLADALEAGRKAYMEATGRAPEGANEG